MEVSQVGFAFLATNLPGGQIQGSGTIAFRIESGNRMVKISESANYRGIVLSRGACPTREPNQMYYANLSSIWHDYSVYTGNARLASSISQNGQNVVFINTYNNQSE